MSLAYKTDRAAGVYIEKERERKDLAWAYAVAVEQDKETMEERERILPGMRL